MCYNRADIYLDLTCNPRVVDNMNSLSYHMFLAWTLNVVLESNIYHNHVYQFTDHQSNQSDPPETDDNPGTRPTDDTSQTQSAPIYLLLQGNCMMISWQENSHWRLCRTHT